MWPNPLQYYLLPEMEETGDDFEELIDDEEGLEEVCYLFIYVEAGHYLCDS